MNGNNSINENNELYTNFDEIPENQLVDYYGTEYRVHKIPNSDYVQLLDSNGDVALTCDSPFVLTPITATSTATSAATSTETSIASSYAINENNEFYTTFDEIPENQLVSYSGTEYRVHKIPNSDYVQLLDDNGEVALTCD